MSPVLARNRRPDRRWAWQLLGVLPPRPRRGGEAEIDPERRFAPANYRIAKGLFDHLVGLGKERVSGRLVKPVATVERCSAGAPWPVADGNFI
jgi:hypothetical protein